MKEQDVTDSLAELFDRYLSEIEPGNEDADDLAYVVVNHLKKIGAIQ